MGESWCETVLSGQYKYFSIYQFRRVFQVGRNGDGGWIQDVVQFSRARGGNRACYAMCWSQIRNQISHQVHVKLYCLYFLPVKYCKFQLASKKSLTGWSIREYTPNKTACSVKCCFMSFASDWLTRVYWRESECFPPRHLLRRANTLQVWRRQEEKTEAPWQQV